MIVNRPSCPWLGRGLERSDAGESSRPSAPQGGPGWRPSDCPCGRSERFSGTSGRWAAATARWREPGGEPRRRVGGRAAGAPGGPGLGRRWRRSRRALEARLYGAAGGDRPPAAARSGWTPHRAQAARRHARAAPPGVPGAPPRRVPLHPVLRALPALAARIGGCRCARSTGPARSCSSTTRARSRTWSIPRPASVREVELFVAVLGRLQLHLRRGQRDPADRRLDREPRPRLRVLRRRHRRRGARPAQERRHARRAATSPRSSAPTRSSARHYGTVILPARPAQPRDKAKVEVGVLVAQRWILARLRNETFFTLAALNQRIARTARSNSTTARCATTAPAAATLFEQLDRPGPQAPARDALRVRAVEVRRAPTSTTTSRSTATTTACRSRCATSGSTCGTPPPPWRSSSRVGGWPPTWRAPCAGRHTTVSGKVKRPAEISVGLFYYNER